VAGTAGLIFAPTISSQGPGRTIVVNGREAVAGEVLVKFARTQSVGERVQFESQVSSDASETLAANLRRLHSKDYDTETLVAFMRTHPDVTYVEPNY
jgi:hypothetical protein